MSARYVVRTVEGYAGLVPGGHLNYGLSALVLDTAYCYRTVAEYTSEGVTVTTRLGQTPLRKSRGPDAALALARKHAARLNRAERRF